MTSVDDDEKPLAPMMGGASMPEHGPVADRPLLGMAAATGAYFLLAVMNVFAKMLSETHHVMEIAFYRNAVALIPFLLYVIFIGGKQVLKIRPGLIKVVMTRSIFGTLSLIVTFAAFAAMPMADTTAFLFTSSLLLPILCMVFLHEKIGPWRWGAIIIGFLGAVIMAAPTGAVNWTGIGLALSAAFMHGVLGTLLRHLGKSESPVTITFYFLLTGTFMSALAMPFIAVMPTIDQIPLIIGLGLSGAAAQLLLSNAFRFAPAALVTLFNYTGIIWATMFGWFIWNDWPTMQICIGGAIVILSNLFMVWREQRKPRA